MADTNPPQFTWLQKTFGGADVLYTALRNEVVDVFNIVEDIQATQAGLAPTPTTPATPVTTPSTPTTPVAPSEPTAPVVTPTPVNSAYIPGNPFEGATLYVDPNSSSAQWIAANPSNPDVPKIHKIASQPQAFWLNFDASQTSEQNQASISAYVTNILNAAAGKLVVFVIYGIPNRDNGGASSGGAPDQATYNAWIGAIDYAITQLGNPPVVFIFEPDAVGFAQQEVQNSGNYAQLGIIQTGISGLAKYPSRYIYVDISMWNYPDASSMVSALQFMIGPDKLTGIRGVALGTSSYNTDAMYQQFATSLLASFPNLHYVTDTSRNGNGPAPAGQWENVPAMALGAAPLTQPATDTFDGNLFIKRPGESDGPSPAGAPPAGEFWEAYAAELATNAKW